MKSCPQCKSVYGDDINFCLNEGAALVDNTLILPSSISDIEADTLVRPKPIIIDLDKQNAPGENLNYQSPMSETIVIKRAGSSKNYIAFLILGLLLGGGLVLITLILARNFYQKDTNQDSNKTEINSNQTIKTSPTENQNSSLNVNQTPNLDHGERTFSNDKFNGRVIMLNAYVRSAPSKSADRVDILPMDDRINIERRENANSPWYYVTCEHGTSGWMHGDTIEFTQ